MRMSGILYQEQTALSADFSDFLNLRANQASDVHRDDAF
jgi:hypothetical protein